MGSGKGLFLMPAVPGAERVHDRAERGRSRSQRRLLGGWRLASPRPALALRRRDSHAESVIGLRMVNDEAVAVEEMRSAFSWSCTCRPISASGTR